jgi:hypothetical protein
MRVIDKTAIITTSSEMHIPSGLRKFSKLKMIIFIIKNTRFDVPLLMHIYFILIKSFSKRTQQSDNNMEQKENQYHNTT